MIVWLKQHLDPNRIAVYAVAVAALATALLPFVTDLGWTQVVPIVAAVASFAGIVAKWLQGWQQYERAIYQADQMQFQAKQVEAQQAREAELAASVSRPQSNVRLPR